jgi:VIT1/CCC1 family predicted Fe2+/Mn2+ transporter
MPELTASAAGGSSKHGRARPSHRHEAHSGSISARLNWLRAGVLGANDGIVSTAALVVGVSAATTGTSGVATAGIAGLLAGAASMALGEYVSVSAQRDAEQALVRQEAQELEEMPHAELNELVGLLEGKGLSAETSQTVAAELTENDALAAHLDLELGIDRDALANPWAAALSSAVAFTVGALLPLLAILLPPASVRIPITFVAALLGLTLTGAISAHLGGSAKGHAIGRLVLGGAIAMILTYGIGELLDRLIA